MSRLLKLDAFAKPAEDARIRTVSGGIVTLVSAAIIAWLFVSEFLEYTRVEIRPELVVDRERGSRLDINFNITFPHMPCHMLTLDVIDVSGEVQEAVEAGVLKTRLNSAGHVVGADVIELQTREDREVAKQLQDKRSKPDYCGPCYLTSEEDAKMCCNTCEDIRQAYMSRGWAFHDGSGIAQCEEELISKRAEATKDEGCNVAGTLKVQKVVGNFHFVPGTPLSHAPNKHAHDTSLYLKPNYDLKFSHTIHHLSFGPPARGIKNPLDHTFFDAPHKLHIYQYFIKVVSTQHVPLNSGSIDTNQYSATFHDRSIAGGRDHDHPHTLHAQGGLPGVYFSYDISPMKVINREVRRKSLSEFATGVCAIVGGIITVAAVIDRGVLVADNLIHKKHK